MKHTTITINFKNTRYPYGCIYTSLAQLLIIVAWSLSLITIYSCYFVNARPIPEAGEPTLTFSGYGLMIREGGGDDSVLFSKCGRYSDFQSEQHIDVAWGFASAFAWMATIVGAGIALVLLTTCCLIFHNNYIFKRLAVVVAICFLLQCMVFLAFANSLLCGGEDPLEYICEWGSGSGLNLGATIMWLLAALMVFFWPVEEMPEEPMPEEPPQPAPRQQNYPALTMGEKPKRQSQQNLPKLTNGPRPGRKSTNNLRITNGEQKRLQITNGRQAQRPSTMRITNGR